MKYLNYFLTSRHDWRMSAFACRRSVTDDSDDRHLSVYRDVHSAAGVSVTRRTSRTGNANIRGIKVAITAGVVNVIAGLIIKYRQLNKAQRIGQAL